MAPTMDLIPFLKPDLVSWEGAYVFISKVHESLNNSLRSGDRVKDFFLEELACLPYLLGVTPFLIQQKEKEAKPWP